MVYNLTPNLCPLCRCSGGREVVCTHCDDAMPRLGPACRCCALPIPLSEGMCGRCLRKPPPVARSLAPFCYDSWVKPLIHHLKFNHELRLAHYFAEQLHRTVLAAYRNDSLPAAIVPVPLHISRLSERGFNQTVVIAKPLARALGLGELSSQVHRVRATPDQIGLSALARRRNVRAAFACTAPLPSHVAILDDVVTTGATVLALTQQLKRTGVKRVDVWCVARTVEKLTK